MASADQYHNLVPYGSGRMRIETTDNSLPWLRFDHPITPRLNRLTVRFARGGDVPDDIDPMPLSVHANSPDGPLIGFFDLDHTGGWDNFTERTVSLRSTSSADSIALVLHGSGGVNLEAMTLSSRNTSTPTPAIPATPIHACLNLGGALESPGTEPLGSWGLVIEERDIEQIAQAGFDTVRLPVRWSDHSSPTPPYQIDPALLDRVDQIVAWALAREMAILIDVHHFHALNTDAERARAQFLAIWKQLAVHYAGADPRLMFEILNEPVDLTVRGEGMTVKRTDALNREALAVIRRLHPNRWVVLGTAHYGSLAGVMASHPPADPRTVLSLHYYDPFDFTHQGAEFVAEPPPPGREWRADVEHAQLAQDFERARYWRDQWQRPLLLGEFGVIKDGNTDGIGPAAEVPDTHRAKWVDAARRLAESHGFGWCYWDYATTFRAYDKASQTWIEPIREALFGK